MVNNILWVKKHSEHMLLYFILENAHFLQFLFIRLFEYLLLGIAFYILHQSICSWRSAFHYMLK